MATQGILLLSAVECAVWYISYRGFNQSGARGVAPTVAGIIISTARKTLARLLVLTVRSRPTTAPPADAHTARSHPTNTHNTRRNPANTHTTPLAILADAPHTRSLHIGRYTPSQVCLGYGTVRLTLGYVVGSRVTALGALYLLCSTALDVASNVTRLDEFALPTRTRYRRASRRGTRAQIAAGAREPSRAVVAP